MGRRNSRRTGSKGLQTDPRKPELERSCFLLDAGAMYGLINDEHIDIVLANGNDITGDAQAQRKWLELAH